MKSKTIIDSHMEKMFFLHEIDDMSDLPRKIYIEPTSMCNLACSICFRHQWIDEKTGHMSFDIYKRIIESLKQFNSVEEVFFGGMGEPLFHPMIVDMIKLIPENIKVTLLTNGTLLTKEMSNNLINAGLNEIWISMDGFEKECYEKIQIGSRFHLIMDNIKSFNIIRNDKNISLGITFVVTTDNIEQLENINNFTNMISADIINISHMIPGNPIKKDDTIYERNDIPVGKMKYFSYKNTIFEENKCPFIADHNVFIRWDGDVAPCMQLLHSCNTYLYEEKRTIKRISYGNIENEDLFQIWNNDKYKAFRQRVYTFYFPFCRVCFGCEDRKENITDCFLGEAPTCGACLWASGKIHCP